MKTGLKKNFIWAVVVVIAQLLGIQLLISYRNSRIIEENLNAHHQAQIVKLNTLDIIRTLHLMDLGIRGFALVPSPQIGSAYDSARHRLSVVLPRLEQSLKEQDFNMPEFYKMRDSVNRYTQIAQELRNDLQLGKREEFLTLLREDYGYNTWVEYVNFSNLVNSFENNIIDKANHNYQVALKQNNTALALLILLVVPTLLYTAYSTVKAYGVSEKLREAQEEKNEILSSQNITLEKLVKERTDEIETQNEEIQANLDFISHRNQQLEEAKQIIEQKNRLIESRNQSLGLEVEKQTKHLRESNRELIRNINQLEQFSYTVSHNLRAPVARLIGLTNILQHSNGKEEADHILEKISDASRDLDQVMRDLIQTIEVKKEINNSITEISIDALIKKTLELFQEEIKDHSVAIQMKAPVVKSISAYLESILFNLVSNAIKYRHAKRALHIEIATKYHDKFFVLTVGDNGLGLDIDRNKRDLFNFYKRFHFHVEGRGLGLYLVKSQVELLGGSVDVESVVDKGTTFTVKLKHNLDSVPS
jgi:signal transduction histidine kinase